MGLKKQSFSIAALLVLASLSACVEADISAANKTDGGGGSPTTPPATPTGTDPTTSTDIPLTEWTKLPATADTVKIYVSSSSTQASDMNAGTTPDKPMKTVTAAKKKLRVGKPDWLLLKEGDTFNESLTGTYAGLSADAPVILTSYCDAADKANCGIRPTLVTDIGLEFTNPKTQHIDNVYIVGLHFKAATYVGNEANLGDTGATAIAALYKHGRNILIEDCLIEKYRRGLFFYTNSDPAPDKSMIYDLRVRRNVIVDTWVDATKNTTGGYNLEGYDRKSNAISLSGVGGNTLIEENLFDKNGYKDGDPAALKMGHNSTIARRGQTFGAGFMVRRNLFFHGGQEGINMENGGQASDNLFVEIPNPITGGMKYQDEYLNNGLTNKWMYPATPAIITGNVVLESTKADVWADGNGIGVFKPDRNARVEGNVVANRASSDNYMQFGLTCDDPTDKGATRTDADGDCKKISIKDNVVVNGFKGAAIDNVATTPANLVSQLVDPNRDVESYMQSLSMTADKAAFLAQARMQSRARWDKRFMAPAIVGYLKEGFQLK